jgi:hypothetical protein
MWAAVTNAIKNEYNSIRIWPQPDPYTIYINKPAPIRNSIYDKRGNSPPLRSPCLGVYKSHNDRISRRTVFQGDTVDLCSWPSRGGVIVFENATAPDFDFLGLDHLDPPLRRDPDQDAEDEFCQKLLLLGASWWDSDKQRRFIASVEDQDDDALDAVNEDDSLRPTHRESGWVRVAWPSDPPGALCVLACEKVIGGRAGRERPRPRHYGAVSLARTMDERCVMLQRLGGTMYASIEEYSGKTFLKAWEENHAGERGPLVHEEFIDPRIYRGPHGDALNLFVNAEECE